VGIVLGVKVGERVERGQPLATMHANGAFDPDALAAAFRWSDVPVDRAPLILDTIRR
jgi:thymidine phosphorylase